MVLGELKNVALFFICAARDYGHNCVASARPKLEGSLTFNMETPKSGSDILSII